MKVRAVIGGLVKETKLPRAVVKAIVLRTMTAVIDDADAFAAAHAKTDKEFGAVARNFAARLRFSYDGALSGSPPKS